MNILGYDWPRLHAALNDLPAALLFVTVMFDVAAWITRRESLRAAALWTLWAGVIGGWLAVVAGLQAEEVIDHGNAIHDIMEPHETLALTTMGIFTLVLAYKLIRRAKLSRPEELLLRGVSFAGLITLIWTAVLGGKMLFEHAAGVPTAVFAPETKDRALRQHSHEGAAADSAGAMQHDDADHEH